MREKNIGGYSSETAKKYVDVTSELVLLTTKAQKQVVWVDNKPTDEVSGYSYWFIEVDGLEPFKIKFEKEIGHFNFLDRVQIQGLEGCEVGNNVYFKGKKVLK